MGFNFKDPKTVYDLTPFTGITFYYKANFVDAAPLRFKIPTVATTVPSDGGTCVSAKCSDDWGQDFLPAQGVWTLRSIKLSPTTAGGDISQIGWGDVYAWNATTALACQWQYTSVAYNFDISVDNITFY
jgi:hypothetical protein